MKENRERNYIRSTRGICTAGLALVLAVTALLLSARAFRVYRGASASGKSVIRAAQDESDGVGSMPELSYRELSADYASLEATCTAWTDLTAAQAEAGEKGGLYFISRENLEFCIFNADSERLCQPADGPAEAAASDEEDAPDGDGMLTLQNFNHIWLNSEHAGFYVVVNLAGKHIDLRNYYILARDASMIYVSRVLINCYEAETVDLTGAILSGTLLAPDATVTMNGAYVYGEVLARETAGWPVAEREVRFTGYNAIMDGLSFTSFHNDSVRAAAVAYLTENDPDGFYASYEPDSRLKKRDMDAVRALDLSGAEIDGNLEQDLLKFRNLHTLILNGSNVTALRLEELSNLRTLELCDTPLQTLDVRGAPALAYLLVDRTSLTELDLSGNAELQVYSCAGTGLGLPEGVFPKLQYMDCSSCAAVPERISGEAFPALQTLNVSGNRQIRDIHLASFAALTRLDCSGCSLTMLDLHTFPNMQYLRCSDNPIVSLDCSMLRQNYSVECYADTLREMIVTRWAENAYASCGITILQADA